MFWRLFSYLIILYPVQGKSNENKQASPENLCPTDTVTYSYYCYSLHTTPASWMEANIYCQKEHSRNLASVFSEFEQLFLGSLIKSTLDHDSDVWIGLHDPTEGHQPSGDGWEWSSNDKLNFSSWERIPPSPYEGYCGGITKNSDFQKWSNFDCSMKFPFICKCTA